MSFVSLRNLGRNPAGDAGFGEPGDAVKKYPKAAAVMEDDCGGPNLNRRAGLTAPIRGCTLCYRRCGVSAPVGYLGSPPCLR